MDFRESGSMMVEAETGDGTVAAPAVVPESQRRDASYPLETDASRDALLTEFGKDTLKDRYLLPGEDYQDLFVRVASAYADDQAHAQRIYDYISKLWFMPATPVLSNGGTGRGLPISCYLNSVSPTALKASSTPGTRMSGSPRAAAASAPIGAMSAASANPSASTARPAASSRSCASWTASRSPSARARCGAARRRAISTSRTPRSRNSSRSANRRATSTARRSTSTTAC